MKHRIKSPRLARLFRDTWDSIPKMDQQTLAERIASVDDEPEVGTMPDHPHTKTVTRHMPLGRGVCALYLNRAALEEQSDRFIRSAIAHELGHIYCNHPDDQSTDSETYDAESAESEADEQAQIWGYANAMNYYTPVQPRRNRTGKR